MIRAATVSERLLRELRMEAQDIAIYGGLAYLIYRLTRPPETPVAAGPGEPEYVPVAPPGQEYVPVAPPAQPEFTVVGVGPAAPLQQTLFEPASNYSPSAMEVAKAVGIMAATRPVAPSPTYIPVAPPMPMETKFVTTNVGVIEVPASYTAYDLYALGYNRPLEEGRQPTQIQYAVT